MPAETSVTTSLPAGTNSQDIITALHNHERYIRITCPQLISYKQVSGPSVPEMATACVYEVTDKRPIGQTTFNLTLVNTKTGIEALIEGKVPTGSINIQSRWTVSEDKLEEAVKIESNMIMKKMIKGAIEKSHPGQHQGFIIEASKA